MSEFKWICRAVEKAGGGGGGGGLGVGGGLKFTVKIFCFSCKLRYHSYQRRVCKFLFLIRTFVKRNSNLTCGSF